MIQGSEEYKERDRRNAKTRRANKKAGKRPMVGGCRIPITNEDLDRRTEVLTALWR